MNRNLWTAVAVILLSTALLLVVGCNGGEREGAEMEGEMADKGTVELVYVNWAEGIAMTNLAKVALEDMGYEVTTQVADVGPVYTSVAQGDKDAFLDAWLPVTHQDYMERFGDQIDDLGYTYEGARIGLVVPSYVTINSIAEMNDVADQFDGEIIGIDAGAGIMRATDEALDTYNLTNFNLVASSGPAMTAALQDAVRNEEWVVVTGWKPHWKFARWDLKFLDDPESVYGEVENIHAVARQGLEEDMPEVHQFLTNFHMNDQQLGSLMGVIADSDAEPDVAVTEWLQDPANQALVESWKQMDEMTEME